MRTVVKLTLMISAISLLTSCTFTRTVPPKPIPGAVKIYTINQEETVEILNQDIKIEPKNWLYIRCNHWSGCYMRCQGKIKSCKTVTTNSGYMVDHVVSHPKGM